MIDFLKGIDLQTGARERSSNKLHFISEADSPLKFIEQSTLEKTFETSSSFHVKYRTTGKF